MKDDITPLPHLTSDSAEESAKGIKPTIDTPAEQPKAVAPAGAPVVQPVITPARPKRRLRTVTLAVAGMVAFIVAVVVIAAIWYVHQLSAVNSQSTEKVKVRIEEGSSLSDISSELKENSLIRNELAFELYVRLNGKTAALQSGTYRIGQTEDVSAIVGHLTSGSTDTFSITFLPGATLQKHRQAMLDAGYGQDVVDAALNKRYDHPLFAGKPASADLEGYIYGETFNFSADATPEEILLYTFDYYQDVITENDLVARFKKQGFSLYEGITMASIIQREVVTPEDAAQVAQVFKKRYDMGMQLGSDVTYQYIADKTGQPRSVDLDSPYNTRRYAGLPPGPISTPGLVALKAVANPASGDYLYFLSGDDDKTYFARTNEEHEKNIKEHCRKKCQII